MSFYPKVDSIFVVNAADAQDRLILRGPASGAPPASWANPTTDDTWEPDEADLGYPVTEWKDATGYSGYGSAAEPTRSWKVDTQLPDGWYTRVVRKG